MKATVSHVLRTRAAILATLPETKIHVVAAVMGLSARKLRRALASEGYTFRELLLQVQHEEAIRLIRARRPLLEIAVELGYSRQSGFARAFKARTNMAPSTYRKRALRHKRPGEDGGDGEGI